MAASKRVIDDGTRCSQHYIGLHSVRQYLTIVGRRHTYRLLWSKKCLLKKLFDFYAIVFVLTNSRAKSKSTIIKKEKKCIFVYHCKY